MTTLSFRMLLGILSLCLLIAPVCAAAPAISLVPAEVQVGWGETVTVTVAIDTLPQGLSGYEIAFGIDDPVVARITAVEFPEWAQMATQSTLPADTLRIKVADLNNVIRGGAANVTLCTLTIRGGTEGLARLSITDTTVDDDAGGRYAPVSEPAEVVVGGGAGTAITMSPERATLLPDQTMEIVVAMDRAPEGLSGYEITVASDDPDVAVVTAIAFPAWAGMNENGTIPAGNIDIKAADLNNAVRAGAADVTLCTLTLRGVAAGSAGIAITRKQIDDDNGGRYAPLTGGCEVTVTAAAETCLSIEPSGVDIAPGDTVEVSIVMDTVPQGLSGYNISMEIPEPEVATIAAISFPDWAEMETISPPPGRSVWMKAVDLKDTIHPGGKNITLCTLTIRGGEKGATTCAITRAKVDDDQGGRYAPATGTARIQVGIEKLQASFTAEPIEGSAPLTVTFTDTSSGEITSWFWEFGDGATATTRNVTHTYTAGGTYTAALTVSGPGGKDTAVSTITVTDAGTSARFSADKTAGVAPLTVRFTDETPRKVSAWLWTFGDGATSADQHPTHTYTKPGNYTVTLSINGSDDTCTKTAYIKVTPLLYGDANNDASVNQADTLRVLKEVVGLTTKPAAGTEAFDRTDVHRNGVIEVGDALFIAQYNVGLRDVWFEPMEQ